MFRISPNLKGLKLFRSKGHIFSCGTDFERWLQTVSVAPLIECRQRSAASSFAPEKTFTAAAAKVSAI